MIDRIRDRASAIGAPPEELRDRARDYAEIACMRLGEVSESVKAYTVKEPVRALGIAFGLGVFLGWMIKHR
jgi:hypothetical protein